ncbi:transcriptional regulator [Ktedonospora formicarum]|uniref:Uncharacterized protein n=1 Tax=Ktedonospora formicarum TaxID=2778364 RepID=A0A8J3IA49_9CHLR|nr:transcriptional regulator [Ktedonospora formicarum]GHO48832.1 hypothetical protein KSX_69950 [Ktedonospora formicarum]
MRLVVHQRNVVAHFSGPWEVAQLEALAEQGRAWARFSRVSGGLPIGEIESQTHEVRLYEGVEVGSRQVVFLLPMEQQCSAEG